MQALSGEKKLSDDFAVYAQSKLAITMWSRNLAISPGDKGPAIIAVNPGSMPGNKMVKEGFGVDGGDISVGAEILVSAALCCEFATISGAYYDNDKKQIAVPYLDVPDSRTSNEVVNLIEKILAETNQF